MEVERDRLERSGTRNSKESGKESVMATCVEHIGGKKFRD